MFTLCFDLQARIAARYGFLSEIPFLRADWLKSFPEITWTAVQLMIPKINKMAEMLIINK